MEADRPLRPPTDLISSYESAGVDATTVSS